MDSMFADIDSLLLFAGAHEVRFGYHRLLVRRFPFAVFYKIKGEIIEVWAILDCRQDTEAFIDRLS